MASQVKDSAGLLEVGSHCFTCNQVDFLPFKCQDCNQTFCSNHRLPTAHDCQGAPRQNKVGGAGSFSKPSSIASSRPTLNASMPASRPISNSSSSSPGSKVSGVRLGTVPVSTSSKPSLLSSSSSSSSSSSAKSQALEKLKSLFPKRNQESSSPRPVLRTKSANQALALAALKRDAKGDSSVADVNRIYVYVQTPPVPYVDPITNTKSTRQGKKSAMFFSKEIVVGKLLDMACKTLDIPNHNNSSQQGRLGIYLDSQLIPYNVKLGMSAIHTGDSISIKTQP